VNDAQPDPRPLEYRAPAADRAAAEAARMRRAEKFRASLAHPLFPVCLALGIAAAAVVLRGDRSVGTLAAAGAFGCGVWYIIARTRQERSTYDLKVIRGTLAFVCFIVWVPILHVLLDWYRFHHVLKESYRFADLSPRDQWILVIATALLLLFGRLDLLCLTLTIRKRNRHRIAHRSP
jgi:hypothetical protein